MTPTQKPTLYDEINLRAQALVDAGLHTDDIPRCWLYLNDLGLPITGFRHDATWIWDRVVMRVEQIRGEWDEWAEAA